MRAFRRDKGGSLKGARFTTATGTTYIWTRQSGSGGGRVRRKGPGDAEFVEVATGMKLAEFRLLPRRIVAAGTNDPFEPELA